MVVESSSAVYLPYSRSQECIFWTIDALHETNISLFFENRLLAPQKEILGGGFKYFVFSPLLGEMIQFDLRIFFQMGWL